MPGSRGHIVAPSRASPLPQGGCTSLPVGRLQGSLWEQLSFLLRTCLTACGVWQAPIAGKPAPTQTSTAVDAGMAAQAACGGLPAIASCPSPRLEPPAPVAEAPLLRQTLPLTTAISTKRLIFIGKIPTALTLSVTWGYTMRRVLPVTSLAYRAFPSPSSSCRPVLAWASRQAREPKVPHLAHSATPCARWVRFRHS